jgi:hypothetical protein
LLIHRSIRASELCIGGDDGPRGCPDANDVTCGKCGLVRTVEDTTAPGYCQCGSLQCTVNRCDRCPVNELEYVRAHSNAGRLFERVLELDFDCANFAVPWSEITAEEAVGLRVLKDERERYRQELLKRPPAP